MAKIYKQGLTQREYKFGKSLAGTVNYFVDVKCKKCKVR